MKTQEINTNDKIVFWGTCSLYFLFVAIIVSAFTPVKIFPKRLVNQFTFSLVYQIRYNVYVKRPGEAIYQLYTINNGKPEIDDLRPFTPNYLFGLKRDYKLIAAEIDTIARDTLTVNKMPDYEVSMPVDGILSDYIKTDTLKFTNVHFDNVLYLSGKYLVAIEEPVDWAKERKKDAQVKSMKVLAVNITH